MRPTGEGRNVLDTKTQSRDRARKRASCLLLYAAAMVLAAAVLSPVARTSFYGDDTWNSAQYSKSALQVQGGSLGESMWEFQSSWITAGRFFPGTSYMGPLFYVVDGHPLRLKLFVLSVVLLSLGLLGYLAVKLSGSATVGVWAILLAPLMLQFRVGSDPILVYEGLLPLIACLVLGSLIAMAAYLNTGKRSYLALSLVAYGIAVLTYEITLPLFLLHFLLIWLYPKRHPVLKSVRLSWPFAALSVMQAAIAMGLRFYFGKAIGMSERAYQQISTSASQVEASALVIRLAPLPALILLAKQVVAALPLTYWVLQLKSEVSQTAVRSLDGASVALFVGYLLIVLWAALQTNTEHEGERAPRTAPLVAVGLGLLVLPNVLIAFSPKYQHDVTWGGGYIPVYLSCLGLALAISVLVPKLLSKARESGARLAVIAVALICAVAVATVGVANYRHNQYVAETSQRGVGYPSELVRTAIARGLMKEAKPGLRLVIDNQFNYWAETREFYSAHSGLRVDAIEDSRQPLDVIFPTAQKSGDANGGTTYAISRDQAAYLSCKTNWRGNGRVIFGTIVEAGSASSGERYALVDPFYVYVQADQGQSGTRYLAPIPQEQGYRDASVEALGANPNDFTEVASGEGWALYRSKIAVELGL